MSSSVLGELSVSERSVEERLRTLALATCALGVLGFGLYFLRTVLVPFVLANALEQMLVPLVDVLVRVRLCGLVRVPRFVAVLLTVCLAAGFLGGLGLVVADSVREFTSRAGEYTKHITRLASSLFSWMDKAGFDSSVRLNKLLELGDRLPLTQMLITLVESLVSTLENLFLILLFTLYLLLGDQRGGSGEGEGGEGANGGADGGARDVVSAQVDAQIRRYIKGKVLLSLLVGVLTGILLRLLQVHATRHSARTHAHAPLTVARFLSQVELWLGFGVIAFWLNFIPNVGALFAVAAPMPLVLFSPDIGAGTMFLAWLLPLLVHLIVGNLLEPIVFGRSMELRPITVLFSLMLWGTLWGVPGLILAVPLTAVAKIHLANIDHPLPRLLLRLLDGGRGRSLYRQDSYHHAHKEAAGGAASARPLSRTGVVGAMADDDEEHEELLPLHGNLHGAIHGEPVGGCGLAGPHRA